MNKYLKFSLALIAFIAIGITVFKLLNNSLKTLLNKRFPPISYVTQQDVSLRSNESALKHIAKPDLAINLGGKDFRQIIDSSLSQFFRTKRLTIPHIKKYSFQNFEISTSKQLINLDMHFELELDTMNVALEGRLSGIVTFMIEHDSLILLPALKNIHIVDISINDKKKADETILVNFLNSTLESFKFNLNGLINSKVFAIDINLMNKKINTENLPKNDTINIVLSKSLQISLPIQVGACMIDESGVHIMAAAHNNIVKVVASKSNPFEDAFKIFQKEFFAKIVSSFPNAPSNESTYFVVQKNFVSGVINQTF